MPKPSEIVPEQIRAIRDRRGWNQEALARRLADLGYRGIRRSTLAKIESHSRGIGVDEVFALAAALDVPATYLCIPDDRDREVEIAGDVRVPAGKARRWLNGWEPLFDEAESVGNYFNDMPADDFNLQRNPYIRLLGKLFYDIGIASESIGTREEADRLWDTLAGGVHRLMDSVRTELDQIKRKRT